MDLKIAPSILSADFGRLNEDIASVEDFCDLIHVDVMDGHFVPNISFGAPVIRCIKSKLPLDVHLMISEPEKYIDDFVKAMKEASGHKEDLLTVHSEVVSDLKGLVERIQKLGVKAGVSIKPGTAVDEIADVLDVSDMVLVMTVEPGFGGQEFMEEMMTKISWLREIKPNLNIAVDGGINEQTAKIAREAGANILVAGSYIFGANDREMAVEKMRA